MDETKIELPAWLPWATTACLAALVACLLELWVIERARNQVLRDEALMADATLRAARNQLEEERILTRREIEQLKAGGAPSAKGQTAPEKRP
jgi:cell division protein FtsB